MLGDLRRRLSLKAASTMKACLNPTVDRPRTVHDASWYHCCLGIMIDYIKTAQKDMRLYCDMSTGICGIAEPAIFAMGIPLMSSGPNGKLPS